MKIRYGFTVIELLAVIAIILTIVGIGIPAYNSFRDRSKIAKAKADIEKFEMSLEMYRTDFGEYPDTLGGLITHDSKYGAYRNNSFIDPWDNPYEYTKSVSGEVVNLRSYGPNGIKGDNDDISNVGA